MSGLSSIHYLQYEMANDHRTQAPYTVHETGTATEGADTRPVKLEVEVVYLFFSACLQLAHFSLTFCFISPKALRRDESLASIYISTKWFLLWPSFPCAKIRTTRIRSKIWAVLLTMSILLNDTDKAESVILWQTRTKGSSYQKLRWQRALTCRVTSGQRQKVIINSCKQSVRGLLLLWVDWFQTQHDDLQVNVTLLHRSRRDDTAS